MGVRLWVLGRSHRDCNLKRCLEDWKRRSRALYRHVLHRGNAQVILGLLQLGFERLWASQPQSSHINSICNASTFLVYTIVFHHNLLYV